MAVYIRSGGAWRLCGNGQLKIRWGGAWQTAQYCHIRVNGQWIDSGYRGYPNAPQSFQKSDWDSTNFGWVNLSWAAPAAGGATVDHYKVTRYNSGGGLTATYDNITNTYLNSIGVSPDERVQFKVEAISTGGLSSGQVGPVRIQMGHAEEGNWNATEARTRYWQQNINVNAYAGNDIANNSAIYVPSSVNFDAWYFDLASANSGFNYLYGTGREINLVFHNAQQSWVNYWPNPYNIGWDTQYRDNGQNSWWGFLVHGSNYTYGNRIIGTFAIRGTETYYVNVYTMTKARVENSLW